MLRRSIKRLEGRSSCFINIKAVVEVEGAVVIDNDSAAAGSALMS